MALYTYDPNDVVMTFGDHQIQGGDDGEFVTVEFNDDKFTIEKDANGNVTRIFNPGNDGRITITLKSSSPSNDQLSAMYIADQASKMGVLPFSLIDVNGRDKVIAPQAWITKMPSVNKAKGSVGTRVWVLEAAEMVVFAGGNA